MTFIARIRHHSLVWKNWHNHAKVSGVLHGVVFRWEPSHIYRSGILDAEQITQFTNHADVELEAVAHSLPGMGEIPVEKPAEEVPEPLPGAAPEPTPEPAPETRTKADWDRLARIAKRHPPKK
jgi:hypothetical protein